MEKVTPVFAACLIVRRWAARIMVSHCTTIFALPSCHRDERRARKAVRERWNGAGGPKEVMDSPWMSLMSLRAAGARQP